MTEQEKEQLIIILRALTLMACPVEDSYRYIDDMIRDLSDMFCVEEEDQ